MASTLITALTVTAPRAPIPPGPVADGEHRGLLAALVKVPDPRDPRGVRYPLSAVLPVVVCAVMAGASSFAAISDWLHDLDDHARSRLGFTDVVHQKRTNPTGSVRKKNLPAYERRNNQDNATHLLGAKLGGSNDEHANFVAFHRFVSVRSIGTITRL